MNPTEELEQVHLATVAASGQGTSGTDGMGVQYALLLWNDENHSYNEVINQVVDATGYTPSESKRIAEMVDLHVRCDFRVTLI